MPTRLLSCSNRRVVAYQAKNRPQCSRTRNRQGWESVAQIIRFPPRMSTAIQGRKALMSTTATLASAADELLTVEEVASILKIGRTKVYELMACGLPSIKLDGCRRFRRSDVSAYIAQLRPEV